MSKKLRNIPEWEDNAPSQESALAAKVSNIEAVTALNESSTALRAATEAIKRFTASNDRLIDQAATMLPVIDRAVNRFDQACQITITPEARVEMKKATTDLTTMFSSMLRVKSISLIDEIEAQGKAIPENITASGNSVISAITSTANAIVKSLKTTADKASDSLNREISRIEIAHRKFVDSEIERMGKKRKRVSMPRWIFVLLLILLLTAVASIVLIYYQNENYWHYPHLTEISAKIKDWFEIAFWIYAFITVSGSIFLHMIRKLE